MTNPLTSERLFERYRPGPTIRGAEEGHTESTRGDSARRCGHALVHTLLVNGTVDQRPVRELRMAFVTVIGAPEALARGPEASSAYSGVSTPNSDMRPPESAWTPQP